jgi:hypothetical protein
MLKLESFRWTYPEKTRSYLWDIKYIQIPEGCGFLHFGFYSDKPFDSESRVWAIWNDNDQVPVQTQLIYSQTRPKRTLIIPERALYAKEGDRLSFVVYNSSKREVSATLYPLFVLFTEEYMNNKYSFFVSRAKPFTNGYNKDSIQLVGLYGNKHELRPRLDDDYKQWLEEMKGSKVCDFCGSIIGRERDDDAMFCHWCGVSLKPPKKKKKKK